MVSYSNQYALFLQQCATVCCKTHGIAGHSLTHHGKICMSSTWLLFIVQHCTLFTGFCFFCSISAGCCHPCNNNGHHQGYVSTQHQLDSSHHLVACMLVA